MLPELGKYKYLIYIYIYIYIYIFHIFSPYSNKFAKPPSSIHVIMLACYIPESRQVFYLMHLDDTNQQDAFYLKKAEYD